MITVCQKCNAKLKIPDERVAAGVLRFKCPRCSEIIEVAAPEVQPRNDATSIKCLGCGLENDVSSSYCANCGAKLHAEAGRAPSAARPAAPSVPAQGPASAPINVKRSSFLLYAIPIVLGSVFYLTGAVTVVYNEKLLGALLLFTGAMLILYAYIYWLIIIYRCWTIIESESGRTTRWKAVGFLLIPIFNFYWIFVAVHGMAQDINTFLDRKGISGLTVNVGLSLAYCILTVATFMPFIGAVALIAASAIGIYLAYQWTRFSNYFVDHPELMPPATSSERQATGIPAWFFAMISVVVAIPILGILAAIAIPGYLGYQKASKTRAVSQNYDTAYRLVQSELEKCGTDSDDVTDDVLAALNAGDKRSPWDEGVPAYGVSIEYRGQVAISETDLRSLCTSQDTVDVWADTDGDLVSDLDVTAYPNIR